MHPSDPPASPSAFSQERRSYSRYAVDLELLCKLVGSEEVFLGKTCDMSSTGVRFHVQRTLPISATVELRIKWPAAVPEKYPLDLLLEGRVIRCDGSGTAVKASRYAFGTRKMTAIRKPSPEQANVLGA